MDSCLSLEVKKRIKVKCSVLPTQHSLLCSSSSSPVDKAWSLACRSRTHRNTDGLVRLSGLKNKQENLPARLSVGFYLDGKVSKSTFTHLNAAHVKPTAVPLWIRVSVFHMLG